MAMLKTYYRMLTPGLRQSYAPPENVMQVCLGGYDPQFMFLMSKNGGGTLQERVRGLIIFNQESSMIRKPVVDEANVKVEF